MQCSAQMCPAVGEIPGRSDAEKALAAILATGRHSFFYAAVCPAPEALELIEGGKWGEADSRLLSAYVDLSGQLGPGGRVFRWSATALFALIESEFPPDLPGSPLMFSLAGAGSVHRLYQRIDFAVASSL